MYLKPYPSTNPVEPGCHATRLALAQTLDGLVGRAARIRSAYLEMIQAVIRVVRDSDPDTECFRLARALLKDLLRAEADFVRLFPFFFDQAWARVNAIDCTAPAAERDLAIDRANTTVTTLTTYLDARDADVAALRVRLDALKTQCPRLQRAPGSLLNVTPA